MAKQLDPVIAEVLKKYGVGHEACWDCHGTWVVYHKYLEQIAAKALIKFELPVVLEADGMKKCAAICVSGSMLDRSEWSIGESSPANNKNAYPYAMAEKRGKDRVILKLIGLHGLAYSEEEADDFKYKGADGTHESDQRMADNISKVMSKPAMIVVPDLEDEKEKWEKWVRDLQTAINGCQSPNEIDQWIAKNGVPLGNLRHYSAKAHDYVQKQSELRKSTLMTGAG